MRCLFAPLLGAFTFLLLLLNTLFWCVPLCLLVPLKRSSSDDLRRRCEAWLIRIAAGWLDGAELIFRRTRTISWQVTLPDDLRRDGWYLVIANHQSWVDIMVLGHLFHRRIPFLKFFAKKELLRLPFIGTALKALDFPIVERHSREEISRRPELRGRDFASAREACKLYRNHPVSIVIFPEGTRFTPQKHARQQSPHRHLLTPRAGGIGAVAAALGDRLHGIVDVTIVYPKGRPNFWEYLCGRCPRIVADVRCREVPEGWAQGDYQQDPEFRKELQQWLGQVWGEKDGMVQGVMVGLPM